MANIMIAYAIDMDLDDGELFREDDIVARREVAIRQMKEKKV
jgi:hypothetical protein